VITWTIFESKDAFDRWYNEEMKASYQVVDEGVSEERAKELCCNPENMRIAFQAMCIDIGRRIMTSTDEILESMKEEFEHVRTR